MGREAGESGLWNVGGVPPHLAPLPSVLNCTGRPRGEGLGAGPRGGPTTQQALGGPWRLLNPSHP